MGWESFDMFTFDLGPLPQGQMTTKLKMFITSGIFSLYVFYYCFNLFAMFGDILPARNKASDISLVILQGLLPIQALSNKVKELFTSLPNSFF